MVISNSEVRCFQRCPREWYCRFVDNRQPIARAAALETGSRIHAALAGEDLPQDAPPLERAMVTGYRARYKTDALTIVRHNVGWRATVGGVEMAGEFDAIGVLDGRTVIVEYKTTSEDLSPGSSYWRRVQKIDPQASTYLVAAKALRIPTDTIVWDALRKPALRGKKGETDDQLFERAVLDMAARPDWYFMRSTIVRLEFERTAYEHDIAGVAEMMAARPMARNPDSCMKWGRECDFFGVCSGDVELDDDTRFTARTYRAGGA